MWPQESNRRISPGFTRNLLHIDAGLALAPHVSVGWLHYPLALAGGPNEWASRGNIVVIRHGEDGKEQRYNVNYREVATGKAQAIQLVPGDTVFVP